MHMFAMFFLLVSCMAGVIINHSSSYLIPFIVVLIFVAFSFQARRRQITRARAHLRGGCMASSLWPSVAGAAEARDDHARVSP